VEIKHYIFGIITGVITSFLAFLIKEWIQNKKAKKLELKKYTILLQSTRNEISFYQGKLNQLSGEINNIINDLQKGNKCIMPSYSLYPDFLEKCKIEINSFFLSSELVKEVGECHFELCHILERFSTEKGDLIKNNPADEFALVNLNGLKILIDDNIHRFSEVISHLDEEIRRF